ncbi:MAG: hypothetical protein JOY83_23855, partial [Alphaproteobacteria bacterium]|nr:hypothetical protein [Alphaproteobacteria bacterium]
MGRLGSTAACARRAAYCAATIVLISFPALAQDTYYINVNPIQLCPAGGACAPISAPGSSQIGFTDPNTQTDITRAILSQAGIDINWGPVQTITSPADVTQAPNTLQIFPGAVPDQISSPDFQNLSFQNSLANGVPPPPPLSSDPLTINLFFTPFINPNGSLTGSTYFGLAWIGNNGAVVDQAIFGTASRFGIVGAVTDALAHELVHVLGLDHPTDNPGQPTNDLMSTARFEPLIPNALNALGAGLGTGTYAQLNPNQIADIINPNGGPLNPYLNPIPGITTTVSAPDPILVGQCVEFAPCWTGPGPTPWSDTLSAANLASLGLGTTQPFVAAQTSETTIRLGATAITFDTTTGPVTESLGQFSGGVHSDPCNFCEIDTVGDFTIPSNATDATINGTFGNSIVSSSAGVNLCLGAGPPCAPNPVETNDFSVLFQGAGRPGESLTSLVLTAPTGFRFDASLFSQLNLPGDSSGITVSLLDPNCTISCTLIFSGQPFVLEDRVDYTIGVCALATESCVPDLNIGDLAGGTYTYDFSDGFQTTSLLELVNGELTASSQNPDLSVPTSLDRSLFTPFSAGQLCVASVSGMACSPELHSDTIDPLIFQSPVPEPPSVATILSGFAVWAVWFGFAHRRRSGG